MQLKFSAPVAALLVFGVWGCYPGSVSTEELDTVVTLYEDEYDFGKFNTYHLPDTIIAICNEEDCDEFEDRYDDQILDRIRENFDAIGFVHEDDITIADAIITVEKVRSDLLVGWNPCPGCWCGYWCWYPGWPWYGGGYNPYYPWWGGTVVYSYPVGTVIITMYDANGDMGMDVPAPWSAAFNGLITGTDSQILARVDRAIDQAFDQSPYLAQ